MNIVGRILTYKQGTKIFPVKVKGYDGKCCISIQWMQNFGPVPIEFAKAFLISSDRHGIYEAN